MEYLIRRARAEDLVHLPALEFAANQRFLDSDFREYAKIPPLDLKVFENWFHEQAMWVAETEETLVGFAVGREVDGQGYLEQLDVHPEHGRRGVGRRLVQAVMDWSAARGYVAVRLMTQLYIPWTVPFYEKLGFRIMDQSEFTEELLIAGFGEAEPIPVMGMNVLMTAAVQ